MDKKHRVTVISDGVKAGPDGIEKKLERLFEAIKNGKVPVLTIQVFDFEDDIMGHIEGGPGLQEAFPRPSMMFEFLEDLVKEQREAFFGIMKQGKPKAEA